MNLISFKEYKIGEVSELLNIKIDTLRFYEKINLLTNIHRSTSGVRLYTENDLKKIRFIKRARASNFALDEIKQLLNIFKSPDNTSPLISDFAQNKLKQIDEQLNEILKLKTELLLIVDLCQVDSFANFDAFD